MPAENMPQLMRYGDKPLFQVQPLVECDTVCRNRSTGGSSVRRGILVCELPDAAAVSKEPIIWRTHRQRTLGRGRACVAESLSALLKTYIEGPLSSQVGQQPLQNARGQGPSNGKRIIDLVPIDEWKSILQFIDEPNWRARPQDDDRRCIRLNRALLTFPLILGCDNPCSWPLDIGHLSIPD